jgi:hypothetical protein
VFAFLNLSVLENQKEEISEHYLRNKNNRKVMGKISFQNFHCLEKKLEPVLGESWLA